MITRDTWTPDPTASLPTWFNGDRSMKVVQRFGSWTLYDYDAQTGGWFIQAGLVADNIIAGFKAKILGGGQ